jgi:RNA 3'-terminal phosphate cyclase (ATP)
MLEIDGSCGEGGGQILRSSLALSLVTGTPFRAVNLRARRARPGLLRQHLAAVRAAAEISGARVEGAELGSRALSFRPGPVRGGARRFSVGSAGSATLVFQTVFPALALAREPSSLVLEGGTHNPAAPPYEFLALAFLPLVGRMGPRATAALEVAGFFPAGGGRFRVEIDPASTFGRLDLPERGEVRAMRALARVARLPRDIADRELREIGTLLGPEVALRAEIQDQAPGPGNAVSIEIACAHVTEVFTGFGARGVPAERVAGRAAAEAREWLDAEVAVGRHLADQLVLPLALGEGGSFRTLSPSSHLRTHLELLATFLGTRAEVAPAGAAAFEVRVSGRR